MIADLGHTFAERADLPAPSDPPAPSDRVALQVSFGARVAALRVERGLSQADLSALSGVERSYLASIERGMRNVTLSNIEKLARALGVTLAELFEGVGG